MPFPMYSILVVVVSTHVVLGQSPSTNPSVPESEGGNSTTQRATVADWATYAPPTTAPTAMPINPEVFAEGERLVVECNDTLLTIGERNAGPRVSMYQMMSTCSSEHAASQVVVDDINQLRTAVVQGLETVRFSITSSEQKRARIERCASQNLLLGVDGDGNDRCYDRYISCPPLEVPENMTVEYEPTLLVDEVNPGVLAKFNCTNGYLRPELEKYICTTTGLWNYPPPNETLCEVCDNHIEYCTECAHNRCLRCEFPYQLHEETNECLIPGLEQQMPAIDCSEINGYGQISGEYWIHGSAPKSEAAQVFCDLGTFGGGWTMVSKFQESNYRAGITSTWSYNLPNGMWLQGCGTSDSIACQGRGTNFPGYNAQEETSFRSLDWTKLMEQGQTYRIRQSVGIGVGNFSFPDHTGSWTFLDAYLDVSYTFTYPGWVLQDDAGSESPEGLVWALRNGSIHSDLTGVQWEDGGLNNASFYPPWTYAKRGRIVNGCGGYAYTTAPSGSCGGNFGSAGIVTSSNRDPPGLSWFPHRPGEDSTCLIWGPHQGGIWDYNNYCNRVPIIAAYWLRRE